MRNVHNIQLIVYQFPLFTYICERGMRESVKKEPATELVNLKNVLDRISVI